MHYRNGAIEINGSPINSPDAMEILRDAFEDLGQFSFIDLKSGDAQRIGRIKGVANPQENVRVRGLATRIGKLEDVKEQIAFASQPYRHPLTARQFKTLMAQHGYESAIVSMLETLRDSGDHAELYGRIKGDWEGATEFHFETVLDVMNDDAVKAAFPKSFKFSQATFTKQWMGAT